MPLEFENCLNFFLKLSPFNLDDLNEEIKGRKPSQLLHKNCTSKISQTSQRQESD